MFVQVNPGYFRLGHIRSGQDMSGYHRLSLVISGYSMLGHDNFGYVRLVQVRSG